MYQSRLIGMHIHGMLGVRDHMAPFEGDLDLNKVLPFMNGSILKVIEARYATKEQIKAAWERLR